MSKIIEFINKMIKYIRGVRGGGLAPPYPATRPTRPPLCFPDFLYYDEESVYDANFNWQTEPFKSSKFLQLTLGNKKRVWEYINELCQIHNINQFIVLVQLQKEQSLITRKSFTNHAFDWALGFGHTDKGKIEKYKGLTNQLFYGIGRMRKLIDISMEAEKLKRDINNAWIALKGKSFRTLDNYVITPQSHTTAMLYSYTPWVGKSDFGNYKAPFGNYLFYKIAYEWWKFIG